MNARAQVVIIVSMVMVALGLVTRSEASERPVILATKIHSADERPSPRLARALHRAGVFASDTGVASSRDSSVHIIGRAELRLSQAYYSTIAVVFRGSDSSHCFAFPILKETGVPRSFLCESAPTVEYRLLARDVWAVSAVLKRNVRELEIDFGDRSVVARRELFYSDRYRRLALWFVLIRANGFPVSVIFKDGSGQPVGGVGEYCLTEPLIYRRN
jgi:hypothetical protein